MQLLLRGTRTRGTGVVPGIDGLAMAPRWKMGFSAPAAGTCPGSAARSPWGTAAPASPPYQEKFRGENSEIVGSDCSEMKIGTGTVQIYYK